MTQITNQMGHILRHTYETLIQERKTTSHTAPGPSLGYLTSIYKSCYEHRVIGTETDDKCPHSRRGVNY